MQCDEIDKKILEIVEDLSGSQVKDIIAALEEARSDNVIRRRLNELDVQGCVLQDRTKERGKVFVFLTPYGREVLAAGRLPAQPTGD